MRTTLLSRIAIMVVSIMGVSATSHIAHAGVTGTNAAKITVSVETKQGGKWITVREDKTDSKGVLEFENVLPGKYKFTIDNDDITSGQTLGLKLRLLDTHGREIDERADVDTSVYVGSIKVPIATYRTDKDGWLDLAGITSGTIYDIDVRDEMHISKKAHRPRIKVKAKIDGSKWFPVAYKRTSKDGWLTLEDVLPGSYKFKYKHKDVAQSNQPFNLKARFRNADGDTVKHAKVKIYAYPFGVKTFVTELKTDRKGWLSIPGVIPNMKYKIKVKD